MALTIAGCSPTHPGSAGPAFGGGTGLDSATVAAGSDDGGAGDSESDGLDETASEPRYDVAGPGDVPELPPTGCAPQGTALSHIWIANSAEDTISKINTESLVEAGRYRTHPDFGDPSRTSVNLNGDVAVANRNGGVAKFFANPEHCAERNGVPGLQTSSGGDHVLAFGEDECMAWFTPLTCVSNRPAAWTRGVLNEDTCTYEATEFWTACDRVVMRLDGETGEVQATATLLPSELRLVYGGAADADGNFWVFDQAHVYGGTTGGLVRIDHETLAVEGYPIPSSGAYGITVDEVGRPFVCGGVVSRFNPDTATWTSSAVPSSGGGCMADGEGRVWHGSLRWDAETGTAVTRILGFDTETLDLDTELFVPEYTHGISIDAEGYIWGVTTGAQAFRVDPATNATETFTGLNAAYTYSDMTGVGLAGAGGGGAPAG